MYKYGLVILFFALMLIANAVELPNIFSHHAVLARRKNVPIWGTAKPGETVYVSIADKKVKINADNEGKWIVRIDLSNVGNGPFELTVNEKIIKDVVVGEVWLASGQSNMAFRLKQAEGAKEEIATTDVMLRSFYVRCVSNKEPQKNLIGNWVVAKPETAGDFSAVAYFFAKKLRQELKVPVGIIHASWGGSPIEPWMDPQTVKLFSEIAADESVKQAYADKYPKEIKEYLSARSAWEKKFSREDRKHDIPSGKWQKKRLTDKLFSGMGAAWIKRQFIHNNNKSKIYININRQNMLTEIYVNGKLIKKNTPENAAASRYVHAAIPENMLKNGTNEIAIRYFNSGNLKNIPQPIILGENLWIDENLWKNAEWEMYEEFSLPVLSKEAKKLLPKLPGREPRPYFFSSRLYNGMIYPLIPYALSGIIWYQGESNSGNSKLYQKTFPAMITGWRKLFENNNLPFYFCQLASFGAKAKQANVPGLANIRNAQLHALSLPHTAVAVLTDCGEANDIHPLDKRTPGERLAAAALADTYNRPVIYKGPSPEKAIKIGNKIKITFKNTSSGLTAAPIPEQYPIEKRIGKFGKSVRNSPHTQLEGFALCSESEKWHWADEAIIEGDCVIVSSAQVKNPTAVRYNWSSNPSGNLYNKSGFPSTPFESKVSQ